MRDDDDLTDDDYHKRFRDPKVMWHHMRPPMFLGGEEGRIMLARVFARISHRSQVDLMTHTTVVLPDLRQGTYLSAKLIAGRNVVALDAELLGLSEDQQVATILPLLAACYLKAPHEWDPTVSGNEVDELFDEYEATGKFREEEFDQAMAEVRGERSDIRVEARMGISKADRLAQEWIAQWNARPA